MSYDVGRGGNRLLSEERFAGRNGYFDEGLRPQAYVQLDVEAVLDAVESVSESVADGFYEGDFAIEMRLSGF